MRLDIKSQRDLTYKFSRSDSEWDKVERKTRHSIKFYKSVGFLASLGTPTYKMKMDSRFRGNDVKDSRITWGLALKIFADNHSFAAKIVTNKLNWQIVNRDNLDFEIKNLAENLFQTDNLFESEIKLEKFC